MGDNKASLIGPPPGFVPGGPNKDYSGDATPPASAGFYNRYYRDWADQIVWTAVTWEITENSIGYQGTYVALGAYYMDASQEECTDDIDCDDGAFCNGVETCQAGSCVAGGDPCPGMECDELLDECIVNNCNDDGTCNNGETECSCSLDCGAPPVSETLSCNDNQDNDCDTLVDCDDPDCSADSACQAPECDNDGVCELGEDCQSCPGDCEGRSKGKPANRFCCGDGIPQYAEGGGEICDGNF